MRFYSLLGLGLFLVGASARADDTALPALPGPPPGVQPQARSPQSPSAAVSSLPPPLPQPPRDVAGAIATRPARPYMPDPERAQANRPDLKDCFSGTPPGAFSATAADCSSWAENDFPYTPIMLGDRSPYAGFLGGPAVPATLGTRYPFQGRRALVWYRAGGIPIWGYPTSRFILLPKPSSLFQGRGVGVLGGGIKISENQSPQPRDRFFFSFNYFDGLFDSLNRAIASGIRDQQLFREIFGLEKTFLDQRASLGIQLPLSTLYFHSPEKERNVGTNFDDMNIFSKCVISGGRGHDYLVSAGLALTVPSGPNDYAGYKIPGAPSPKYDSTNWQPFLGYLWSPGRWYVQGFSSIAVPTASQDILLAFNDLGVGYFVYQDTAFARPVTAIAPTFEVHANTPLNHLEPKLSDPVKAVNEVDLTFGVNVGLYRRTYVTFGLVVPVSEPRPFDLEVLSQLNVRLGRPASRRLTAVPPAL